VYKSLLYSIPRDSLLVQTSSNIHVLNSGKMAMVAGILNLPESPIKKEKTTIIEKQNPLTIKKKKW
jgi:hypothetical protein